MQIFAVDNPFHRETDNLLRFWCADCFRTIRFPQDVFHNASLTIQAEATNRSRLLFNRNLSHRETDFAMLSILGRLWSIEIEQSLLANSK